MSEGDPNCLLSVLWGHGRSVALNNVRNDRMERRQAISNTFIKAMKEGNAAWDVTSSKKASLVERRFSYAHLAVSPREIIEAEGSTWESGIAVLNVFEKGKKEKQVILDPGTKMFKSIQKSPHREEIMKRLRDAEKNSLIVTPKGPDGLPKNRLEIAFENKPSVNVGPPSVNVGPPSVNVGPSLAMKRILSIEGTEAYEPYAGGNIPLFCDDDQKEKRKIPVFRRELGPKVEKALGRQKDLLECLEKDTEGYNLFPYMENIFVMDWYSVIERHLFRIHCSGYGERTGLKLEKFKLFDMYSEKIEKKMHKLFSFQNTKPDDERKYLKWYEKWILDYRAELSAEEKEEKYKEIRIEMVHKKYDKLRRRERRRPPTKWLVKNGLLSC